MISRDDAVDFDAAKSRVKSVWPGVHSALVRILSGETIPTKSGPVMALLHIGLSRNHTRTHLSISSKTHSLVLMNTVFWSLLDIRVCKQYF